MASSNGCGYAGHGTAGAMPGTECAVMAFELLRFSAKWPSISTSV